MYSHMYNLDICVNCELFPPPQAHSVACPSGLKYNPAISLCDWATNVDPAAPPASAYSPRTTGAVPQHLLDLAKKCHLPTSGIIERRTAYSPYAPFAAFRAGLSQVSPPRGLSASRQSQDKCLGAKSTCWSPGQEDVDCKLPSGGYGLCAVSRYSPAIPATFLPTPLLPLEITPVSVQWLRVCVRSHPCPDHRSTTTTNSANSANSATHTSATPLPCAGANDHREECFLHDAPRRVRTGSVDLRADEESVWQQ